MFCLKSEKNTIQKSRQCLYLVCFVWLVTRWLVFSLIFPDLTCGSCWGHCYFCHNRLYLTRINSNWVELNHSSNKRCDDTKLTTSRTSVLLETVYKLRASLKPHLYVAACQLAQGVCMCVYQCVSAQWETETRWLRCYCGILDWTTNSDRPAGWHARTAAGILRASALL